MSYIDLAMRTNSPLTGTFDVSPDLIHATFGLVDEFFELNAATTAEEQALEAGDLCWFVALAGHALGCDPFAEAQGLRKNVSIQLESLTPLAHMVHQFASLVKRAYAYGKPLDVPALRYLLAEITVGMEIVAEECQKELPEFPSFQTILDMNIAKLAARYPDKFTTAHALNRDEAAESEAAFSRTAH